MSECNLCSSSFRPSQHLQRPQPVPPHVHSQALSALAAEAAESNRRRWSLTDPHVYNGPWGVIFRHLYGGFKRERKYIQLLEESAGSRAAFLAGGRSVNELWSSVLGDCRRLPGDDERSC